MMKAASAPKKPFVAPADDRAARGPLKLLVMRPAAIQAAVGAIDVSRLQATGSEVDLQGWSPAAAHCRRRRRHGGPSRFRAGERSRAGLSARARAPGGRGTLDRTARRLGRTCQPVGCPGRRRPRTVGWRLPGRRCGPLPLVASARRAPPASGAPRSRRFVAPAVAGVQHASCGLGRRPRRAHSCGRFLPAPVAGHSSGWAACPASPSRLATISGGSRSRRRRTRPGGTGE